MRWVVLWTMLIGLILLPFLLFEETIADVGAWMAAGGVRGGPLAAVIGGLLALDVFLPVPSSLVSTLAGAVLGFWPAAMVIWVGMTIGAGIGYGIGAGAAPAARWMVGPQGLARAERLLDRHGTWALAACRAVPVLAEASVVFAGLARVPLARFAVVMALANLGIAAAYATVGAYAMQLDSFLLAFAGAIAVPAAALLLGRYWQEPR